MAKARQRWHLERAKAGGRPTCLRGNRAAAQSRFAAKYGLSKEAAAKRIEGLSRMGRDEGIGFNYATALDMNMPDADRLTKLAHTLGNTRFEELCYEAYFVENEVMADRDVQRALPIETALLSGHSRPMTAGQLSRVVR